MKTKLLIIIAIALVSLLTAVFLYLLFFGAPKNPNDVFTDLGLAGEEDGGTVVPPTPVVEETPVVNMERPRLRQLTTKPVIGFTEVTSSTSPYTLYYAEAGTGHIFSINLDSGVEERISNTTIAEANFASFSPDGRHVVLRSRNERRTSPLTIGTLDLQNKNLVTAEIAKDVSDFKVLNASELIYTLATNTGLENRIFEFETNKDTTLFTVPFYEAVMQWGTSSKSRHYVYPKPTYLLEGYLYSFSGTSMTREPIQGFGLTAINTTYHVPYNTVTNLVRENYVYHKASSTRATAPILMLPEKCTQSSLNLATVWCGYENITLPTAFPDDWYSGKTSFKDSIWQVNLQDLSAKSLVNTFTESEREIDIVHMAIGASESALYFINKNDNTLWMYEL
jgi:hypothetical protein